MKTAVDERTMFLGFLTEDDRRSVRRLTSDKCLYYLMYFSNPLFLFNPNKFYSDTLFNAARDSYGLWDE